MDTDTAYCRAQVEQYDPDRYILTLAAAPALRPALWAVYAFNHELAKTREVTREAHAGHLRLAWWREHIDAFYAGADMPGHDVARALGVAITAHNLEQEFFSALIDARAMDMGCEDGGAAPASLDGLCAYADAVNTPLVQLTAQILQSPAPAIGTAWGVTGLIRALPWLAQQNRCILPLPMLHDIGLMPEQFHHLQDSPALRRAIAAMAARAREEMPRGHMPHALFRHQRRMIELFLARLEKAKHNPFDRRACGPVPFLGLRIFLS